MNSKRLSFVPKSGGSRLSWPEDLQLDCHKDHQGHSDVYGRMNWNLPSPALTCKCTSLSNGRFGHPSQLRAISLREAALLQTFPDDYKFFGMFTNKAKQIGNAVPVLLAKVFAGHLMNLLNQKKGVLF
jgi:DNA (cytosine-5)-methyltransferase 1